MKIKFFWKLVIGFVSSLLFVEAAVAMESVVIPADDSFELIGDLYVQSHNAPGIILLHQCNMDRNAMTPMAETLFDKGYTVLNVDQRGFGESVSEEYRMPTPRTQEAAQRIFSRFVTDADAVFEYFEGSSLVQLDSISLMGASCGGTMSLRTALSHQVKSAVLISPGGIASWMPDEQWLALSENDLTGFLIVVASDDNFSPIDITKRVFDESAAPMSQLIIAKGQNHGVPLLEQYPNLIEDILNWLIH